MCRKHFFGLQSCMPLQLLVQQDSVTTRTRLFFFSLFSLQTLYIGALFTQ